MRAARSMRMCVGECLSGVGVSGKRGRPMGGRSRRAKRERAGKRAGKGTSVAMRAGPGWTRESVWEWLSTLKELGRGIEHGVETAVCIGHGDACSAQRCQVAGRLRA